MPSKPSPSASSIRERLQQTEHSLITALGDGPEALQEFEHFMLTLHRDVEVAIQNDEIDEELMNMLHATLVRVEALAEQWSQLRESCQTLTSTFTEELDTLFSQLTLEDISQAPKPQKLSSDEHDGKQYTKEFRSAAYTWLLANLQDPYPPKLVMRSFCKEFDVTLTAASSFFKDAREQIGWTSLRKNYFGGSRREIVQAVARAHHMSASTSSSISSDLELQFGAIESNLLGLMQDQDRWMTGSRVDALTPGRSKEHSDPSVSSSSLSPSFFRQAAELILHPLNSSDEDKTERRSVLSDSTTRQKRTSDWLCDDSAVEESGRMPKRSRCQPKISELPMKCEFGADNTSLDCHTSSLAVPKIPPRGEECISSRATSTIETCSPTLALSISSAARSGRKRLCSKSAYERPQDLYDTRWPDSALAMDPDSPSPASVKSSSSVEPPSCSVASSTFSVESPMSSVESPISSVESPSYSAQSCSPALSHTTLSRKRQLSDMPPDAVLKRPRVTPRLHAVSDPLPLRRPRREAQSFHFDSWFQSYFRVPEAVSVSELDASSPVDIQLFTGWSSVDCGPAAAEFAQCIPAVHQFELSMDVGSPSVDSTTSDMSPDPALGDAYIVDPLKVGLSFESVGSRLFATEDVVSELVQTMQPYLPFSPSQMTAAVLGLSSQSDSTSSALIHPSTEQNAPAFDVPTPDPQPSSFDLSVAPSPRSDDGSPPPFYSPPPAFFDSFAASPAGSWDPFNTDLSDIASRTPPPPYHEPSEAESANPSDWKALDAMLSFYDDCAIPSGPVTFAKQSPYDELSLSGGAEVSVRSTLQVGRQ